MSRAIRIAEREPVAWKNGGGSTTELAIAPAGAGYADFDWRISLATISRDGPFSSFPGVDRSLALVDGPGVLLEIDGKPLALDASSPLIEFRGEAAVGAKLRGGASTDFNVMTRRARWRHRLRRVEANGTIELPPAELRLIFLASGERVSLWNARETLELGRHDAALLDDREPWTLEGRDAAVLVIELHAV